MQQRIFMVLTLPVTASYVCYIYDVVLLKLRSDICFYMEAQRTTRWNLNEPPTLRSAWIFFIPQTSWISTHPASTRRHPRSIAPFNSSDATLEGTFLSFTGELHRWAG